MFASYDFKAIFGKTKVIKKLDLWTDWKTKPGRRLMFEKQIKTDEQFADACGDDLTDEFQKTIEYAIENDENLICMLEAPQGEGKSKIAQKVMVEWVRTFYKIKQKRVHYHFTFNQAETQNLLAKLQDGDIICQDEDTKLIGRGASTSENELQNLIETMRFTQKSIIICSPKITLLPGMNLLLRPFGKFKYYDETHKQNDMKTRVLWYQLREDPGHGIKFIPLGYIIMALGDTKLIEKSYLEFKRKNYRKLERNKGGSTSQSKEELKRWQKEAKRILKVALKDGWPSNSDQPSKKDLSRYIMQLEISCSNQQEDFLKGEVVRYYRKGLFQQKKVLKTDESSTPLEKRPIFEVNLEEIITEIKRDRAKDPNLERDLEIYYASKDPLRTAEKLIETYNISPQRISQVKRSMEGAVNEKIGNRFELFLFPYLKEIYDRVEHLGGVGKSDFICWKDKQMIIYSIKCYKFSRKSYSLPYSESKAELDYARKNKDQFPIVICYLFNLENQKIYEHVFDSKIIQINTPYTSRNISLKLEQWSRDPLKDPWVIIPK